MFVLLLIACNLPILGGSLWDSMIFRPSAALSGEWWRWLLHPFVHVTWYHLLLDGAAFLILYSSLADSSLVRRLAYVVAGAAGSLFLSWAAAPAISTSGLCGLSGVAHGLMAVSAVELVVQGSGHSMQGRLGWISLLLVVGKAAAEALTGRMFFTFLHFGLMGEPVAVSHAGGIVGSLLAWLAIGPQSKLARAAVSPEPALRGQRE